jgi:hypothetical protein
MKYYMYSLYMPKLHRKGAKTSKRQSRVKKITKRHHKNGTRRYRKRMLRGGVPVEDECVNVDIGVAFIRNYGMDASNIDGLVRPANLYYTDARIRYAGNLVNRCAARKAARDLLRNAVERFGKQAVLDRIGEMEGIEPQLISDLNAME